MKPSPALTAIARTAARTCEADDALILRLDGNSFELVAKHGRARTTGELNETFRLGRDTACGRAILTGRTIHVPGSPRFGAAPPLASA